MTERELTALHEAGHIVITDAVGWTPGAATVNGGDVITGCSHYRYPRPGTAVPAMHLPLAVWPHAWQDWIIYTAMIAAAGDLAERLLTPPRSGRGGGSVIEQAAARLDARHPGEAVRLAEAHPLAAEERAALVATVQDPGQQQTDDEVLAHVAWLACGDSVESLTAFWAWVGAQTRDLVLVHADRIERLAGLLHAAGDLCGEAIRAALREPA